MVENNICLGCRKKLELINNNNNNSKITIGIYDAEKEGRLNRKEITAIFIDECLEFLEIELGIKQ